MDEHELANAVGGLTDALISMDPQRSHNVVDALLQLSRSIVKAGEMIATAIQEDAVERDRLARRDRLAPEQK